MNKLNPQQLNVLDLIGRKSALQSSFFRQAKGLIWFDELKARGYFDPSNNPLPIHTEEGYRISSWPLTEYLVNTSVELKALGNEEYATKFLSLIRDITKYSMEKGASNYWTWLEFAKIIQHIQLRLITEEDITLIDFWLADQFGRGLVASELGENWLPSILRNIEQDQNNIAIHLLNYLFKINFVEKPFGSKPKEEAVFRYESWNAKEICNKVAKLSGIKLGLPAVNIFQSELTKIFEQLKNDKWSAVWRPAIKDHEQNHDFNHPDSLNILITAYRDCLFGTIEHDIVGVKLFLRSVLDSPYLTLKRVVIHIIDAEYPNLKDMVDLILKPEYFEGSYRFEVWHFIQSHFTEFDNKQKDKVLHIIEDKQSCDEQGKFEDQPTAYNRSLWLSAIKDSDKKAAELYQKYISITKVEPEHPDFAYYMTTSWGKKSLIAIEDLLKLDLNSLIETIRNFKSSGKFDEPDLEDLAESFKNLIKSNPINYYRDLPRFLVLDLPFIHPIIETYQQLWSEKKELPWNSIWPLLLEFCTQLVAKNDFWNARKVDQNNFLANIDWIISDIGRLVEAGVKTDEHSFEASLLPVANQLLLNILAHQKGTIFKIDDDAVMIAINSPRGQCLEALINLSLRACRLADKEEDQHPQAWARFESIFNEELKRNEFKEYEFATLVAMYLPNFLYMSSKWTLENLPEIFDQHDYQKWLCSMQGYSYVSTVYFNIQNYLKKDGSLLKALEDENIKERVHESVIDKIMVSHLRDEENINDPDSLITAVFKRKNYADFHTIIWFLWTLNGKNVENLNSKVFVLWPKILDSIDLKSEEGKKVISQLCRWTVFINKIDTNTKSLLLQIVPYSETEHNAHILIENLARLSDNQPSEVQDILLKMIEIIRFYYNKDDINKLLTNFINIKPGGERKAKDVADAFLKRGDEQPFHILEEIRATKN